MKKITHLHFFAAALLFAALLTLSWQPFGMFFLSFVAFVPLLWIEKQLREKGFGSGWVFLYGFVSFLLWNLGATWWVWNASAGGAVAAFIANSLLMSLPFMLYHRMQKRGDNKRAQQAFIFFWIAFEYGHFNWEGTWPWLALGNVFSSFPAVVQWYEYTGILGGTLWVLYTNIHAFRLYSGWAERSRSINLSKTFNLAFFLLFAPAFLSFYLEAGLSIPGKTMKVMVVQPNIDPYREKFGNMSPEEQTKKMLTIASEHLDSSVSLVCFPETSIVGNVDESAINNVPSVQLVREFVRDNPQLTVLTGADTYRFYNQGEKPTVTARKYNENLYYDSYNTALVIDHTDRVQIYHKSKLVPGVERMPYPQVFSFIEGMAINMGGTMGSLGTDPNAKALDVGRGNKVAPVICYESVFGEYVGKYIQDGAGLVCVITNDGWWGNTPGYRQHFDYSRLRAVETRKYIARSANTGISGFIDPAGNVMSKSAWWVEDALTAEVKLNTDQTFYVKYGDYLGKTAVLLSLLFLFIRKRNNAGGY